MLRKSPPLKPLTPLFSAYSVSADGTKKLSVFRPAVSASINRKLLSTSALLLDFGDNTLYRVLLGNHVFQVLRDGLCPITHRYQLLQQISGYKYPFFLLEPTDTAETRSLISKRFIVKTAMLIFSDRANLTVSVQSRSSPLLNLAHFRCNRGYSDHRTAHRTSIG